MKLVPIYISIMLLALSGYCRADAFEDGLQHFGNGDYPAAYSIWHKLAEKGDADAQYYVGQMLYQGKGVAKNVKLAYAWLSVSSKHGSDMAKSLIGDVKQELSEAQIAEANLLAGNLAKSGP